MERWLPVVAYEGLYEVSDLGRIKSLRRESVQSTGRRRVLSERILSSKPHKTGYRFVTLYRDGAGTKLRVHLLVMAAFVGPKPTGMEACHGDGDRANSALSNLRYDTPSGNHMDRVLHGTSNRGERHGMAILNAQQAASIRIDQRRNSAVARDYCVSPACVRQIKRRTSWAWL